VPGARAFLDWAGGLIWLETSGNAQSESTPIRAALGATGGHATLVRASADARASTDVFHPQPEGLAALSRRVKAQFDPQRVLNPGRMYAAD
jgi:glycolate oxidase FAD binding subunit